MVCPLKRFPFVKLKVYHGLLKALTMCIQAAWVEALLYSMYNIGI